MSDKYTGKQQDRRYEGDAVDITYNAKRCIHAELCAKNLPQVFDPNKRPWINPNEASVDDIAQVISTCPSGALHVIRKDGGAEEATPDENVIILRKNGELILHGNLKIQSARVDVQDETRATLCRCGASENKPFCDNTHKKINFQASAPTMTNRNDDAETGGTLTVTAQPNGSIAVVGNFRIEDEEGNLIMASDKTWLCRCGHSEKKPFCDGTHKKINFEAE